MKLSTKKGELKMTLLTEADVRKVYEQFSGTFEMRNKGLFMIGVSTGTDISELLTLTIGDVYQKGKPVDKLFFNNRADVSGTVPVNQDGIEAIQSLINWHVARYGNIDMQRPLFPSRNGRGKVALSTKRAHDVLRTAFIDAGLNDKVETQSLCKFAVQPASDLAKHIFAIKIQWQHNNNVMSMYIDLNGESVKDFIIKPIKQGITLIVTIVKLADEWLPTLIEFILEVISGIF